MTGRGRVGGADSSGPASAGHGSGPLRGSATGPTGAGGPYCDTAVETQHPGVGWLRGTGHGFVEPVLELLSGALGTDVAYREVVRRYYRAGWRVGLHESSVAYSPTSGRSAPDEWCVDVTQSDLGGMGWDASVELAIRLEALGCRWSRVDVYVDCSGEDWADRCRRAFRAGEVCTHAQTARMEEGEGKDIGRTFYVGSRESEQLLRVYVRWEGSGHPGESGTRFELECKGEAARWIGAASVLASRIRYSASRVLARSSFPLARTAANRSSNACAAGSIV